MIIDIGLKNWMSFRDQVSFTMESGNSEQHSTRVSKNEKFGLSLLPVAAILGGNASGKSNFVNSLDFARDFIVNGTNGSEAIRATPFLLNKSSKENPTKFYFKLLINDKIFEYSFSVTRETVESESLSEMTNNESKAIFDINNKKISVSDYFGDSKDILEKLFDINKKNQLFLTTICKHFNFEIPVYCWFRDNLSIITPSRDSNTFYSSYFENENILSTVNDLLKTLDCGVDELKFVPYEASERERTHFKEQLKERDFVFDPKTMVFAKMIDNEIETDRLVAFHKTDQNELVEFGLSQESNGTNRLFELLPAFLRLTQSGKNHVFVIDEFEQSLHTNLIQALVRAYLDNCNSNTNSQLIFTTHNVLLMSENLLRTDEIWLTKRQKCGSSKIYSIYEFENIESVENIPENYLTGLFGGIPRFLLIECQLQPDL